ncbi:MAG: AAA-like domain-containing protein [bacterium]
MENHQRPSKTIPFKFTGPLDPEQDSLVSIIRHEELKEVIKGVSNQTYYALVGPRQTGKTTFLFQLSKEIAHSLPGFLGVYLTLEDLVQVKHEEFYKNFARKIVSSISNRYQLQPASLKDHYKTISTNLDLKDFLLELAKAKLRPHDPDELHSQDDEGCIDFEPKEYKGLKFILLVDEIDAIPHDIMIEFVKTVRSLFIERLSVAGFRCYTMVLCGSADLASLTYGKTSPFNISKVIYLRDFSYEEIRRWLNGAFQHLEIHFSDSFAQQLFSQTQGHPYLTQILCFKILTQLQKENRHEATVDDFQVIDEIITDGDINLLTTLERIKTDEILQEMTLKILKGDAIRYSRTHDIIYHLELAGAIRRKDEYCRIRNPIYEKFFKQHFSFSDHNASLNNCALKN